MTGTAPEQRPNTAQPWWMDKYTPPTAPVPAPPAPAVSGLDELEPAAPPPAPDNLGGSGRAFWEQVTGEFEVAWRPDEVRLLTDAANTVDIIENMQRAITAADGELVVEGSTGQQRAHPLLSEIRQQRTALKNLIKALNFAGADFDPDDDSDAPMSRSESGRKAAMSRWHGPSTPGARR